MKADQRALCDYFIDFSTSSMVSIHTMDAFPLAFAVLLLLLIALSVASIQATRRTNRVIQEGVEALHDSLKAPWGIEDERRIIALEDAIDRLPQKWEEIKAEARRSEQRARDHARSARKELEERGFESPGLEAVAQELRLVDGEGGDGEGMQPMRPPMEAGQPPEPEDWNTATMRYKYGR